MSRGMVSFLAGMGSGYLQAKEKGYERERQAKEDAWREEQRGRQRSEWQKADSLDADLRAAANPVSQGVVITDNTGSNAFTADADAAAIMADMAGAKNDGVMTQHATRVAGTAYTDPAKAAEATKLAMTPDAESQRVQDVYRRYGMRDKAMQEFVANEAYKTAMRERMTKMETEGVTAALGLLKAGAPEQAMDAFQKSGSVNLPDGSKFVQASGTDMFTGQPGKVWSVVGPDGKTIVADVGQVTAKYLGIADQFKFDADIAKGKQAQANADREYGIRLADLEIRANEAKSRQEERALRAEIAQLRASRAGSGGGGGGGGSGGAGVSFDPYEGFDPKNAQAEATRTVDEMLVNSGKQVNATERARLISEQVFALRDSYAGQNANRHRASAFIGSARSANTPQEIEAVRQQALSQGFTNQQMAELDPRFAVVGPKPATGTLKLRPPETPAPMSAFEARRKAAQAEDEASKKAADEAERAKREKARQEALKARPDLQQLGGMRYFN